MYIICIYMCVCVCVCVLMYSVGVFMSVSFLPGVPFVPEFVCICVCTYVHMPVSMA